MYKWHVQADKGWIPFLRIISRIVPVHSLRIMGILYDTYQMMLVLRVGYLECILLGVRYEHRIVAAVCKDYRCLEMTVYRKLHLLLEKCEEPGAPNLCVYQSLD